jgi:hypothetical protein
VRERSVFAACFVEPAVVTVQVLAIGSSVSDGSTDEVLHKIERALGSPPIAEPSLELSSKDRAWYPSRGGL